MDGGVDAFQEFGFVLIRVRRVAILEPPIDPRQTTGYARGITAAKGPEQIRDAFAVLPFGEVRQLQARGIVAGAGFGRIKGFVNVLRGGEGFGGGQRAGVILGHVPRDVFREEGDGLLAEERLVGFPGDALPHGSMATEAVLAVDDFTGTGGRQVLLIIALSLPNADGEQPDGAQGADNLENAGKGHAGVRPSSPSASSPKSSPLHRS